MAVGQWEVVGGSKTKKNKNKSHAGKGSAKEPVKAVAGPIIESPTMYNALAEKEKKEVPKQKANGNEGSKNTEKNVSKKKKVDKKPAVPKASFEEIFANQVTEEDFKNHIATLEVLCPDSPLLWLKDLASFLNVKLDVPVEDLTFCSKPLGYPSILLNKKVHQSIVKIYQRCTPQMLQLFYDFCLQNLVQDTLKGLHTLGYRIMLQCLAHEMPFVAVANLPKCMELCQAHQNRQNICLSVLWAAGQAANNNLEAGFRVWIDLMFPLIGSKNCTAYAVDYVERLISSDDVMKCNKSLLDVRDLFPILDFIYSKELVKSIQKRLIAVYPTLKALSYGPEPETVLRNYFPSYLRRLEPHCPQPLKEEILNSLMFCLEKDSRCYSIWRQLYIKHFIQSKLLISHMNDQWETVPPKFPKKYLRDTLSAFQVTNEELLNNEKKTHVDIKECILVNKELLSKINAGSFSWVRLVLFLILMSGVLLSYDIWSHGSFAASRTGKLMKDSGFLLICTQASEKLLYFYGKVKKLSEKYVPVVVSWCRGTLLPFLELSMRKLSEGLVLLWNYTAGFRLWLNVNIPPIMLVIEKQFVTYSSSLWSIGKSIVVVLSKSVLITLTFFVNSADSFAKWIQSSPEIMSGLEAIKNFCLTIAGNVQQNAMYMFQLAKNYFPFFPA